MASYIAVFDPELADQSDAVREAAIHRARYAGHFVAEDVEVDIEIRSTGQGCSPGPPEHRQETPQTHGSAPMREIKVFRCGLCKGLTVTVQLDEGAIPESISCRAKGFAMCRGAARPIETPPDVPPPKWEWINPRAGELARMVSDENHFVRVAVAVTPLILQVYRGEVARAE